MINLPDDVSVHVFKGVKLMGIYDETTGFPRLDKEWARNRNRDIEDEVIELREQLVALNKEFTSHAIEIEKLLSERDDNTFKYGLAGRRFDREYEARMERKNGVTSGADTDGDFRLPEVNGDSRFRFITEEMVTLYSKKNADYGDAFTQSLDEDGLLVSKIRIKDKLNRFSQLIDNDALVNDESMRDTLIDLANYTVMTLMWLDENE